MKACILLLIFIVSSQYSVAGSYLGKVRPYYWGERLYLGLVDVEKINPPPCAKRNIVRLQESDPENIVYQHKFAIILAAWMANKDVDLKGTGTCSSEGDEYIRIVMPK